MQTKLTKEDRAFLKQWKAVRRKVEPITLSAQDKADLRRAYFAEEQGRRCNFVVGGPIDQCF